MAVVGLRGAAASSALLTVSVCVAGIVVAGCWWFLLRNYRRLNEAKFAVINRIEAEHLPVKVFSDEWAMLGGPDAPNGRLARIKAGFKQLGAVEKVVPVVFALLYVMLLIGRLVA